MLGLPCCSGFSLVVASRGCVAAVLRLLTSAAPLAGGLGSCGSQAPEPRLSSCGPQAYLLPGIWGLPGSGIEPMSPAFARWILLPLSHQGSPLVHFLWCWKVYVFVFSFWHRVPKTFRISWVRGLSFVIHRVPLWAVPRFRLTGWLIGGWWLGLGSLRWNLVARRAKHMIKGLELCISPIPYSPPLPWETELEFEFNHQWPVI